MGNLPILDIINKYKYISNEYPLETKLYFI